MRTLLRLPVTVALSLASLVVVGLMKLEQRLAGRTLTLHVPLLQTVYRAADADRLVRHAATEMVLAGAFARHSQKPQPEGARA